MIGSRREWFGKTLIAELPTLRRYARALAGNSAIADDLVQDTIERALKQWQGLRDTKRIAPWLRSILHNLFIDEVRRVRSRGREEEVGDLADDLLLSTPVSDGATAIDFTRAMASLSVEHRQVLLLVGVENRNYREVADELGIPIGTVMSRLARGRERLRSALEGERGPLRAVPPAPLREVRS